MGRKSNSEIPFFSLPPVTSIGHFIGFGPTVECLFTVSARAIPIFFTDNFSIKNLITRGFSDSLTFFRAIYQVPSEAAKVVRISFVNTVGGVLQCLNLTNLCR